jgi:WD40 repeat protein
VNPFVGPQPFQTGQPLFGREREITELRYLLTSERIVLLYSPSGAGKSSLVNAGLIPKLQSRFDIWGPTRVNTEAPPDHNRYAWSAIAGLDKSESHTDLTLAQYAASRPRTNNPLLIFDQFEEILRVNPADTKAKEAFFAQLGELLADPKIWALFILREDYLAPLDPYVNFVPTHLQNRFRIDRLTRTTAAEAILKPLQGTGRSFAPGAVEALVDNLATSSSDYIEPLQLQVVCYDLWERMERTGKSLIQTSDLGDVSSALRNYYDRTVATANLADERTIRQWFERELITPDGVRNQVRQQDTHTGSLPNTLITRLEDAYLVRAEPRGKTRWYELAHDRLVPPVRASNLDWFDKHLHKVEKLARTWTEQDQPASLLLVGPDLVEAAAWASAQPDLTPEVRKFLDASREKAAIADREATQARRLRRWLATSIVCLIAALAFAAFAGYEGMKASWTSTEAQFQEAVATRSAQIARDNAEKARISAFLAGEATTKALDEEQFAQEQAAEAARQKISSDAGRLASAGELQGGKDQNLETLLAIEAFRTADNFETRKFLLNTIHNHHLTTFYLPATARTGAFSADGNILAAAGGGLVHLWDIRTRKEIVPPLTGYAPDHFSRIVFSKDGWLAYPSGGNVRLWRAGLSVQPPPLSVGDNIFGLAFSPDGKLLAAASINQTARLWDVATWKPVGTPLRHRAAVTSVAFGPSGKLLATTIMSTDSPNNDHIYIWNLASGSNANQQPIASLKGEMESEGELISSILFTSPGQNLAWIAGSRVRFGGTKPEYVNPNRLVSPRPMHALALANRNFAFDDNRNVKVAYRDGIIEILGQHHSAIQDLAFSTDGGTLASASDDQTVRVWNVNEIKLPARNFTGHKGAVRALAFSPDGKLLVSASDDATVRLWDVRTGKSLHVFDIPPRTSITQVAFSADSRVVAASSDKQLLNWNVATFAALPSPSIDPKKIAPKPVWLARSAGQETELYDSASGKQLTTLPVVNVIGLAATPDNKLLATGGVNGSIRLWDFDPQSWIALACTQVNRNLTRDEWTTFVGNAPYRKTCQF